MTDDDVVQACIEDAVFARFEFDQPGPVIEGLEPSAGGAPELVAAQAAMREFARGGR